MRSLSPIIVLCVALGGCTLTALIQAEDLDSDGWSSQVDCDDGDPRVHPGASEIWYDGIDQNCDFLPDDDADFDGWSSEEDCDDHNPLIFPGAPDVPYDGVNSDCADESNDGDGDGYSAKELGGSDCNDADPTTYRGADDPWYDGIDQDCRENDDFDQDWDQLASSLYGGPDCDDTNNKLPQRLYEDLDGDGYGVIELGLSCDSPAQTTTQTGECDDGRADLSPAESERCADGLDNDCDGSDEGCALSEWSYVVGEMDLSAQGTQLGDRLGIAVAGDMDLNGDGLDEIVSGACRDDTLASDGGAVLLWWGAPSPSTAPDLVLRGEVAGGQLGLVLAAGADLSGDGLAELAIAAPYDSSGAISGGAVWLVSSPSSGDHYISNLGLRILSEEPFAQAGRGLALGDMDGDGQGDLLVGAPGEMEDSGAVYLMFGPITEDRSLSDAEGYGLATSPEQYGEELDLSHDLNGDGYLDLVVGAPAASDSAGGLKAGAVRVFYGPLHQDLSPALADTTIYGDPGDALGTAFVGLSLPEGGMDLILGAPEAATLRRYDGASIGLLGPGEALASETGGTGFGHSLSACDLDGDGLDELLVGQPVQLDSDETGTLVFMSTESRGLGRRFTVRGPGPGDAMGYAMACAGNVNGDLSEELVLGAPYLWDEKGQVMMLFGEGL